MPPLRSIFLNLNLAGLQTKACITFVSTLNSAGGIMINLKTASLFGLLIAIIAMATLVFRESMFAVGPVTIAIQVLAALLMLWARITFGSRSFHAAANPTEGGLVKTGPYKFLRHPIYAAILYFAWAGIAAHPLTINFLLGFMVTIGLFIRMFAEERLVVQQYPDYVAYAAQTKRIIPFIF
jgi:protein-S-isoprenylcysteine O-methyltransferase Ste14